MLRRSTPLLAILFISSAIAIADAPKAPPKYAPKYLTPQTIDVVTLLPDPPPANSPEHEEEFVQLLKLQKDRTPEEVARATEEEHHLTVFSFADVLGPDFTPEKCPKTAEFFRTALTPDLQYFSKTAKAHWERPRPHTDSRIHSLFTEKDGSYPSGHSTRATLFGEMLSALLPQDRDRLVARSQQMGWDREIAGVHYPSDVYAGRVLGKALATALLAKPEIQSQLEALKPELEAALKAK